MGRVRRAHQEFALVPVPVPVRTAHPTFGPCHV